MEAPETSLAAKNGLRLGYGLCTYTGVDGGVVTHGHDGGIDGFISSYSYMPEQNWGYVILLNSDNSQQALESLNHLAMDFLSKDFVKPQQPVITLPAKALEMFEGYYAPRAPRSQLFAFVDDLTGGTRIRVINGKLTRSGLFGRPEPLLYVGKTMFRGEKEPEGTTVFFATETADLAVVSSGLDGISYSERSSLALPFIRIVVLALCLLFMLSSLPYALFFLSAAIDPRAVLGSPCAKGGNSSRREDLLAAGFFGVLRAYGFSSVLAPARAAIVGAVRRAIAIKTNGQQCSYA